MFNKRQNLKNEGNYEEAKKLTGKIRRKLKNEKLENNIKHLEEELWFDIKKAKATILTALTMDCRYTLYPLPSPAWW